jgi:CBS domain-containing protein
MAPNETVSVLPVEDVMHPGLIECLPQTPVSEVAVLMAELGVRCVVVGGLARGDHGEERFVWGIVSDLDLMRAIAAERLADPAAELAVTEIVTIAPHEPVARAAQLMGEHDCAHLIVAAAGSQRPLGVISSLDVARAIAWGASQV